MQAINEDNDGVGSEDDPIASESAQGEAETGEEHEDSQVIQEELIEAGKVGWADYKEFFSYAFGGLGGIVLIVFLHIVINLCTLSVSLFLAFSLTKKFTNNEELSVDEKKSRNLTYNVVLISIITFALLSSFVGKFLSNKIFMGINRRLHDKITKGVLQTGIIFFEENT